MSPKIAVLAPMPSASQDDDEGNRALSHGPEGEAHFLHEVLHSTKLLAILVPAQRHAL
jgi:hypothetical protein